MTESQAPDIEIYVADLSVEQALTWLEGVFDSVECRPKQKGMPKTATPVSVSWQQQAISGMIFEKAAPGFTSIWLNSSSLPWSDDEQCARAAAEALGKTVRITAGGWQQNSDPDAWLEISPKGHSQNIIWRS